MNIAIVGFAIEGTVSLRYFLARGHQVTICDRDESVTVPQGVESQVGDSYLDNLDRFDLIVRSAGIQPSMLLEKNPGIQDRITTAVDEFLAHCPTKNTIGITGTKGKGTTSTLTAKMLEAAGHTVWLGGNIGRSPLEFIDQIQPDDWVVLELSSFQLIDLRHSPHIAACLMVVPEHLNWHTDLAEYIKAKSQLFTHQQDDDIAVYFSGNDYSRSIATSGQAHQLAYGIAPMARTEQGQILIENTVVAKTSEVKLLGEFNLQNVCAAITLAWQAGVKNLEAIRSVVKNFSGLEHHLEFVRKLDGICYYDDSFGTIPETAIVAMQAFEQPKVMILGGSDKGASYDELASAVTKSDVRHVVLIGDQAIRIQQALDQVRFDRYSLGPSTMPEIVDVCRAIARSGDVVLLSTGCASFGLFKDYKDRGNQFKKAVKNLA